MNVESVSVIVTTYNAPDFLEAVLRALNEQTYKNFDILVADDGSTDETGQRIERLRSELSLNLRHIWQEDTGFRVAEIRNKAAVETNGEYLIFLDGDCIPFPDFVERHLRFSEQGFFTAGNRILLQQKFTEKVIEEKLPINKWGVAKWFSARISGGVNRLLPLLSLPDGKFRKWKSHAWKGVRSCNMACWKKDFFTVNGYDERYQGWGREDSDFAIRLMNAGVLRKDVRYAIPVLHMWHNEFDRGRLDENDRLLSEVISSKRVKAEKGVDSYG